MGWEWLKAAKNRVLARSGGFGGSLSPAIDRLAQLRDGAGLKLILAAFIILSVTYSVITPIFEAPDEIQHFFYVKHLADGGGLPVQDPGHPGLWGQEGGQPPLYYALASVTVAAIDTSDALSLLWQNPHANIGDPLRPDNKNRIIHTERESWPYRGTALAVHLARWLSVLLAAGTVWLVYKIAGDLLGRTDLALAAAALTAFNPQFLFIGAAVSNDSLIAFLAALAAWLLVRIGRGATADENGRADAIRPYRCPSCRGGRRPPWHVGGAIFRAGSKAPFRVILGLVLGLAGLTKLGGLALWPLAAGVLLIVGPRRQALRRTLLDLALVFAVAVAVAGWWYLRNWQLYGDPTGLNRFLEIVGRRDHLLSWRELWGEFEGLRISYWALFGWFNVPLPTWVYRALDWFSLVALAGLPLACLRRSRANGPADLWWLLLPVAWIGLSLIGLVRWTLLTPGTQGRLLFPAIWAISLLLVVGWDGWRPAPKGFPKPFGAEGAAVWLALPIVPLALLAILCPFLVIRPAYAKPPLLTVNQIPHTARRADVAHAGVLRLVASELPQDTIRPGERLPVTLYWQAVTQTDQDLSVFVHLLGPDGKSVGQLNSYPGLGAYPTSLLEPNAIIKDTYQVPVAVTATAPVLLQVDVGLYQIGVGGEVGLPATDSAGQPTSGIIGAVRLLPHRPPAYEISHPERFDLDGQAILLGYDLQKPGFYRPGDTIELALYWQAQARMTEDYHVFVHLVGPDGQTAAQGDKAPLDGAWPTWAWEPGYPVRDVYPVRLPTTLAPGTYELRVGLYRVSDGWRVPVQGPAGRVRDAAIILEQLEVR